MIFELPLIGRFNKTPHKFKMQCGLVIERVALKFSIIFVPLIDTKNKNSKHPKKEKGECAVEHSANTSRQNMIFQHGTSSLNRM